AGLTPVMTPAVDSCNEHIFHQYTVRVERRDALQAHLKSKGIGTAIYYPVPLHLQNCFSELGYKRGALPEAERAAAEVLSLPVDLLARVDAVIVAAPATTHAQLALECIAAGKPCLVEKPFALSVRDAEAVARSSAERKVPVAAGHLLVFHPAVERLRALVRQG